MTTELTAAQIEAAARQLAESASTRIAVEALGIEPGDAATGYLIQDAGHALHGDPLVGWKVGCTSEFAQNFLGVDGPLAGRYRSDHTLTEPAQVEMAEFVTPPHLEVEVGFRLLADLEGAPLDAMQLADAVEAFAAIEVVAGRLTSFPVAGGPQLVADNVFGARMVVGSALDLDPSELRALDTTAVVLTIDDEDVAAGTGAEVLGHPLAVLSWLADHAARRGTPLRSGELIITGSCTGLVPARVGATHVGHVGNARVELKVT